MRFGSVCSGIEAASCAWHPLGWRAAFVSEIDPFPCAVLAHHYPDVPNFGDMTRFKEWPDATIDVLVGGTPCQSFSVAGLRKGLDDPRGNLMLTLLAIADRYRPRWLVWENVPGVLSSGGGRDFGTFLGGLGELGYGFAYRVLDAQYFGVAQRRRRVFVVGCVGDWRRAAAVLFERHSLQGHPAPRREAGKGVASRFATDTYECGGIGSYNASEVSSPLLRTGADKGSGCEALIAHTLRGEGFDASEDGTGRGTPLVPVAFSAKDHGSDAGEIAPTLRSMGHDGSHANGGGQVAVAFAHQAGGTQTTLGYDPDAGTCQTLGANQTPAIAGMSVRRLTPMECERLQGFPDGYTAITVRGKPAADGPRYKALGNSMAVPVMAWIGLRIQMVEQAVPRSPTPSPR